MFARICQLLSGNLHNSLQVIQELESQEYKACSFSLKNKKFHYRQAKVTPIKIGAFVTFWQRDQSGPIQPYASTNDFDFLVIAVQEKAYSGFFIFSKEILVEKKYVSLHGHGGKLGFRVYPSWVIAENKQALQSQAWQKLYFVDMNQSDVILAQKIQELMK